MLYMLLKPFKTIISTVIFFQAIWNSDPKFIFSDKLFSVCFNEVDFGGDIKEAS